MSKEDKPKIEFTYADLSGHFYAPDGTLHSIRIRLAISTDMGQMAIESAVAYRIGITFNHLGKPAVIPLSLCPDFPFPEEEDPATEDPATEDPADN
jgi:hypothetical protein